MPDFISALWNLAWRLDIRSLLDIFLIALVFYWMLLLLRGTTAMALLRGVIIVLIFGFIFSRLLQLTVLGWLLRNSLPALLLAIPILFQPELRRALERIGRGRWAISPRSARTVDSVVAACLSLSGHRHGALVVSEKETGLRDLVDSGIELDDALRSEER